MADLADADAHKRLVALWKAGAAIKDHSNPGPDVVAALYEIADRWTVSLPNADEKSFRRYVLRRVWWEFYPTMKRSAAARCIAARWNNYCDNPIFAPPGSEEYQYQRLARREIPCVGMRTIIDDLDDALNPLHVFCIFDAPQDEIAETDGVEQE